MTDPKTSHGGGDPKAYGQEFREAIQALYEEEKLPKRIFQDFLAIGDQWAHSNVWEKDPLEGFDKAKWEEAFHKAELIRRFEERCGQLYGAGKIWGFCHLCIGQEAVSVGTFLTKEPQDSVITAYRDHGHMLAAGEEPGPLMAEMCGKVSGSSLGKGGSMHVFAPHKNFWGGHGIVGASSALGAGLAFAHKYLEDQGVSFIFFGDGAANQGQLFECFNMTALWELPAVFIIENNFYAMGTPVWKGCAGENLFSRGEPFGIQGFPVNGLDFLQVRAALQWAREEVLSNGKPVLLEVRTYRFRGHSMSDPGKYRKKDEVDLIKQFDPLKVIERYAQEFGQVAPERITEIKKEVKHTMAQTIQFAEEAPEPESHYLATDIYK